MYRHSNNSGQDASGNPHTRMGSTDTLERINGNITRDQAMGVEHAGITQGQTRTCPRATAATRGTTNVRGNTDNGIGDSKINTPVGQQRQAAGLLVLNGQNPHTMPAASRWQRGAGGQAVQLP